MERLRVAALLKFVIDSEKDAGKASRLAHPLGWLAAFVKAHGQERVWTDYQAIVEALIKKYLYDPDLMVIVTKAGPIQDAYFERFEKRASSSQFDTANPAAQAVPSLDETLGAKLSPERAFRVLAAITSAAEYNAFNAKDLHSARFASAPTLRDRAAEFGAASAIRAKKILKELSVTASLDDVLKTLTH